MCTQFSIRNSNQKCQSLFQYIMSYKMAKESYDIIMIYIKEAKSKFNIKREKMGKRKSGKEKGGVIIDIHNQCVWVEIQNTYQRMASAEVIIRLTNFKRYVNFCGGVHGFICIICWNNNVFGIWFLRGSIILFLSQLN